ncbi:hypothetical protein [Lederbergia graminis]|uniref:Uncharacterized protein n=1 Tax=Lederbergia graminis TaxID=735518 RepID=A0ABW0LFS1_9BACI|nr:hypothetical protein [Paenibacillus bovis]
MSRKQEFIQAVTHLEKSLANALNAVSQTGTPENVENFTKLMIKKEIILSTLLDEIK